MTSRILALDPSSSSCGYAVLADALRPALVAFGVIRPPGRLSAAARIDLIVAGVRHVFAEHHPGTVVVEWSDGRTHGRLAGRKVVGLQVLGQAQGAVRQALVGAGVDPVIVGEAEWTNSVPKPVRAAWVALEFPAYRDFLQSGQDGPWRGTGPWGGKGLDAADSIGIGLWHLGCRREAELLARAAGGGGAG